MQNYIYFYLSVFISIKKFNDQECLGQLVKAGLKQVWMVLSYINKHYIEFSK